MQPVSNAYKFSLQTLRHHDNRPRSFAFGRSLNNLSMGGCFFCATISSWQQLTCSTSLRSDCLHLVDRSLHFAIHAQARSSSSTQAERKHAHGAQSLRTQHERRCRVVNSCSHRSHSSSSSGCHDRRRTTKQAERSKRMRRGFRSFDLTSRNSCDRLKTQ